MEKLAALAFVWALVFAMLFLPARKVSTWIARPPDGLVGTTLSILLCLVLAWTVVLLAWLALIIGGREVFPHVNPLYFGLFFVAVVLFGASLRRADHRVPAREDVSRQANNEFFSVS